MRVLLLIALAASSAATAQTGALIDKAQRDVQGLEYPSALKSLEAALKIEGNDRAALLRIYELQGVVLASLGQDAKAVKAFQTVLVLDPDFKLAGNHPPRVSTAYYEARAWTDQNGKLEAQAAPATLEAGRIKAVRVELKNDPLKLVKEVRFHLVRDGKELQAEVSVANKAAFVALDAWHVTWWAELLGERKAVLTAMGSAASPKVEGKPGPVAVAAPTPAPAPPPTPSPEPRPGPESDRPVAVQAPTEPAVATESQQVEQGPPAKPMPGTRVAGLVMLAGAAVAIGVGIGVGVGANGITQQVAGAERDGLGRVTGMTQTQALALDAEQRTLASVSNVLVVGGAALAATGVVLVIVSVAQGPTVALAPAGAGVTLAGTFP